MKGGVDVWLANGESKIYVPKSMLASKTELDVTPYFTEVEYLQ